MAADLVVLQRILVLLHLPSRLYLRSATVARFGQTTVHPGDFALSYLTTPMAPQAGHGRIGGFPLTTRFMLWFSSWLPAPPLPSLRSRPPCAAPSWRGHAERRDGRRRRGSSTGRHTALVSSPSRGSCAPARTACHRWHHSGPGPRC